jgi:hypothetical protein
VAALAADITTYVIGVANPPVEDAPDTVSNLHQIADAGGTQKAFLIDTGDPTKTSRAFETAMDQIRQRAISCRVAIPSPPPGAIFDKQKVAVSYASGGATTDLVYDTTCSQPHAWRYDDQLSPGEIVLCEDACTALNRDREATLDVKFACQQVITLQ